MRKADALTAKPARWFSVYAGFVLTGMVTTLLGPLLPVIASSVGRRPTELGSLFTAQFLSSTVGTLLAGVLVQRYGFRVPLSAGYALMGLGIALVLFAPWPWVLCAVGICGVGIGFVIPTSNMFMAEVSSNRSGALSRLNACWAGGAILFPLLIAAALRGHSVGAAMLAGGAILLVWGVWMLFVDSPPASTEEIPVDGVEQRSNVKSWGVIATLFFLYVGSENSVSGWIAAYSRSVGLEHTWVLTPSLFWACLVAGRMIAPRVLRHASEYEVCLAGLGLSIAGGSVLARSQSPAWVVAGSAVCGLGFSAVYPIFIAALSRVLGGRSRNLTAAAFAISGIGAATLPWCIGALANATADMRWGLTVPVAGAVIMLVTVARFPALFETPISQEHEGGGSPVA
jgi:FHS family glucose/mannose:H+ symporter-like MFS transporter